MSYREHVSRTFKNRRPNETPQQCMKRCAVEWRKKRKTKGGCSACKGGALPSEPKGVYCYFSSTDLTPIGDHGGTPKGLDKAKRISSPLVRDINDIPLGTLNGGSAVPYITMGQEKRSDGTYDVVTVTFYYIDNPNTGPQWPAYPKRGPPLGGFHDDDIEFVSIYYMDGKPVKVFWSQHSVSKGEGHWEWYDDCQFKDGYLVVYVARNSHANYPTSGTHKRVYGAANDYTESTGPHKAYPFSVMKPSFDWNNGQGITLYKGLRPAPPDGEMSARERIIRV